VGLGFKRLGIGKIIEVCILRIGHSRPRARASYPSCVTAYPRGSRSRVFMALLVPHSQFMSKAGVPVNFANREAKRLENLRGPIKVLNPERSTSPWHNN
jgi:hypothetical protein